MTTQTATTQAAVETDAEQSPFEGFSDEELGRRLGALDAIADALKQRADALRTELGARGAQGRDPIETDAGRVTISKAKIKITDEDGFQAFASKELGLDLAEAVRVPKTVTPKQVMDVLAEHAPQYLEKTTVLDDESKAAALDALAISGDDVVRLVEGTPVGFAQVELGKPALVAGPRKTQAREAAAEWVEESLLPNLEHVIGLRQ